MILNMKLTVSNRTRAPIMSLVRNGVTYFKTLGDCEGIKRCKEWAANNDHAINPNTLPKL